MRSPWWRSVGLTAALLPLVSLLAACGGSASDSGAAQLNWHIFNPSASIFEDAAKSCSDRSGGEYRIAVNFLPAGADQQRQQMVRRLAAQDDSLDILGLDVTWTPEFAEAQWIAPWPADEAAQVESGTLKTMVDTATWRGKLYSAPYNTNTQLLWYRKDLVSDPPETWDEMLATAEQLDRQGKPHLIEVQGAQYEGLTVWFNTMVSSAGGQILTDDGSKVDLGAPAVTALQAMHDLATSVAADPSLSNQMENDNRLAFESGDAAFELNYPFVYPSAKTNAPNIFENMAWAPFPEVVAGQPARATIGGIDLAVAAFSRHKQAAFDAIQCLRGRDLQIANAVQGGLPPVDESIYTDPTADFVQQYPFYREIFQSLQQASVRPQTPAYQSVSIVIANILSPPSSIDPQKNVSELRTSISDALQSKGLIP